MKTTVGVGRYGDHLTREQARAIGRRIRALRELRGETQTVFARHLGVAQNTLSDWERGRKLPNRIRQFEVADVLRQSRSALFREIAEMEGAA